MRFNQRQREFAVGIVGMEMVSLWDVVCFLFHTIPSNPFLKSMIQRRRWKGMLTSSRAWERWQSLHPKQENKKWEAYMHHPRRKLEGRRTASWAHRDRVYIRRRGEQLSEIFFDDYSKSNIGPVHKRKETTFSACSENGQRLNFHEGRRCDNRLDHQR